MAVNFCIHSDHPALLGHFPGQPIVPGVVILNEVIHAYESNCSEAVFLSAIPTVKFLQPLLPEKICTVEFSQQDQHVVKFKCSYGDQIIATGSLYYSKTISTE